MFCYLSVSENNCSEFNLCHIDPEEDKMLIVESRFIAQTPGEISVEEGDLLYLIAQSNR